MFIKRSGKQLCKRCFIQIIERRISKHFRKHIKFKKLTTISIQGHLALHFTKIAIKDFPVKLVINQKTYKINQKTASDLAQNILEELFTNKKTKTKGFSILEVISDKEAIAYAKLKNIPFKPNKKKFHLNKIVDKFDEHILFTIIRNYKELNGVKY